MKLCFITILILQLDGTILKDKHEVPITLETKFEEEVVVKCSEKGEEIVERMATHHWEYVKGDALSQGWYLNDNSGRMVIGYLY